MLKIIGLLKVAVMSTSVGHFFSLLLELLNILRFKLYAIFDKRL